MECRSVHTVTVVPDPIRMLDETKRVCRPGGKIVIVNHFTTDLPVIGPLTEALDPITRRLGWRTKLRLEPFLKGQISTSKKSTRFPSYLSTPLSWE
jgi:phosphatidylethanolamine/phosphatidyl-N-methylethanolamine N-methyltransferase